jgi:hypothetical protein
MQIQTHQTKNIVPPELVISVARVEAVNNCRLLGMTKSDTMNWLPLCDDWVWLGLISRLKTFMYIVFLRAGNM